MLEPTSDTPRGADLHALLARLGDASYSEERCDAHGRPGRRDPAAQARAQRRRPGAQLPAPGDLPGRGLRRRLARAGARRPPTVDADVIVFCGVHFMAETAKILNPSRRVILPDLRAGCSLADSVTAEELAERKAELRAVYPDLAVVGYVNTTADVKAECDACCTSSNAVRVVEALPSEHILFVPDQQPRRATCSRRPRKTIIAWDGNCYVHQQITPGADRRGARRAAAREGARASRVPQGRAGARRRRAQHQRHGALREGEPGARVPGRHRVRPVRPPAARGAREALLQELQALRRT